MRSVLGAQLFFSSVAQVVVFIILLSPPVIMGLVHAILYFRGRGGRDSQVLNVADSGGDLSGVTIVVPVKDEPESLVLGMINHMAQLRSELRGDYEVVFVCDDPPEKAAPVKKSAEKLAQDLNLKVRFMIRTEGRKGRAAALNWVVRNFARDVVIILDVDTRPQPGYLTNLVKCVREGNAACVGRWDGYWIIPTKLARAVGHSMKYLVDTLYRGRASKRFFIFPLGSGTAFDKSALLKVGLWDEGIVQDDMHIGTKLMWKGYRVGFIDNVSLKVLVPSRYEALKLQQARWSYGAMETLKNGWRRIFRSPHPLLKRVEATLFLMQYVPHALLALSGLVIPALALLLRQDIMLLGVVPTASLLVLIGLYGYSFYSSLREAGLPRSLTIRTMGASSSFTISLSPIVLAYTVIGLLRNRYSYRVTPKGESESALVSRCLEEKIFLAYVVGMMILNIILGNYATGLWLLMFIAPLIYTLTNAERIIELRNPQPGLGSS